MDAVKLESGSLANTVWFLDFDGCLCPHREVWEEHVYDAASILSLVRDLNARAHAVFWNTGRRVESLGGISNSFLNYPGYFVQGSIFWDAETRDSQILGPVLPEPFKAHMRALIGTRPDIRLELKPTSLRVAPLKSQALPELRMLLSQADQLAPAGWRWSVGHRGAELLAENFDKGAAVTLEMTRQRKLAPDRDLKPVAVGDDILDRRAVEEAIKAGGYAVLVGDSCGWITEIPHRAWQVISCETPDQLHEWIKELSRLPPSVAP